MKKPLVTDLQRGLESDEKGLPKRKAGSGYPVKTHIKAGGEEEGGSGTTGNSGIGPG